MKRAEIELKLKYENGVKNVLKQNITHHIMINLLGPQVKEDWPMDGYSTISFSVVTKLGKYEKRC